MKTFPILILSLLLICSLNLFAQVRNGGWDDEYKSQLSTKDIVKLSAGNEVFLNFEVNRPDYKAEGVLRVIPNSKNGEFTFVEIGNWKKEFDFKRSNSDKGNAKVEMTLDSLGNIISSKAFEKQADQLKYLLREELTLQKEVVNSKTYAFNFVKSYYNSGELWIEGYQRILDFDIPKSYMDKKSVPAKYEKKFDKKGKVKKEKTYSLTGE